LHSALLKQENAMKRLYVLYDGACGVCCRAVARLAWEPTYIELRFAPAGSMAAQERFKEALAGSEGKEVVVVADSGEVYRGASAWIMVLYALRKWRPLAMRLATPGWRPWVERAIDFIGRHRFVMSGVLGCGTDRAVLAQVHAGARLERAYAGCVDGACGVERVREESSGETAARLLEAKARVRVEDEKLEVSRNPLE
jgi:predicted DCC family thiol-disulfide oxidoreductase YuxK